jgi:DNA-binding NtrC family response regulator
LQNIYLIQRHAVDSGFVISGESGAKTKDFCRDLGAAAYFEKPVDFDALRDSLAQVHSRRMERRKEVRVGLRVPLKLSGGTRVVRILACQARRKMSAKGVSFALARWF